MRTLHTFADAKVGKLDPPPPGIRRPRFYEYVLSLKSASVNGHGAPKPYTRLQIAMHEVDVVHMRQGLQDLTGDLFGFVRSNDTVALEIGMKITKLTILHCDIHRIAVLIPSERLYKPSSVLLAN